VRHAPNTQGAPQRGRPARKIMIAAIAISILIHLILAGYLRWPFNLQSAEGPVVKVRTVTVVRIPPHTPPPAPVPTAHPAPKPSVIPVAVKPRGSKGPPVARVLAPVAGKTASPTRTPAPSASPTGLAKACFAHGISPAIAATAPPVDIPPDVRASKASGVAQIQVQIDPQGEVTNTTVAQSSGNAGLDNVAEQMAKSATYSPALVKCKPVASVYTYSVRFFAW
jgi:TonB family protein